MIRNERVNDLQTAVQDVVYVPLAQAPRREIKLIVRTRGDAAAVMPGVREAVRQIDPHLPLGDVRTMKADPAAQPVRNERPHLGDRRVRRHRGAARRAGPVRRPLAHA